MNHLLRWWVGEETRERVCLPDGVPLDEQVPQVELEGLPARRHAGRIEDGSEAALKGR